MADKGFKMPDDERLGELLGGAMSSMRPEGACPPLEDLAALSEGRLTLKEEEALMGHVAACDKCREVFAMVSEPMPEPVGEVRPVKARSRASVYRWLVPAALAASIAAAAGYTLMISPGAYKGEPVMELAMQDARTVSPEAGADEKTAPLSKTEPASEPARGYYAAPAAPMPTETKEQPAELIHADDNAGVKYRSKAEAPIAAIKAAPPMEQPSEEQLRESKVAREGAAPGEGGLGLMDGAGDEEIAGNLAGTPAREMRMAESPAPPKRKQVPVESDRDYSGRAAGGYAEPSITTTTVAPVDRTDEPSMAEAEPETSEGSADSEIAAGTNETPDNKVKGTVVSVDLKKGVLVFVPLWTEERVSVTAEHKDDLKGLEEGDGVRVLYKEGDMRVATRIKKVRAITLPVGC